jgi:glycine/D-amino acid oxidase-like deaminating enzyme
VNIVVIGAGAFGAWAAHHLRAAGASVTLIDAYGPASARASSGDESRIIRCGYGPDAIYSRWARRSLGMWQAFFDAARARPPLFHACGVLWLAAGDDPYTNATRDTLQRDGHPVALLDEVALRQRFPHITAEGISLGLYEPDCGVIMARRAVQLVVADLVARGVRLLRGRVTPPRIDRRLAAVTLTDGRSLAGDAFVFACGPWLPALFPGLLAGRIRPTRQVVVYFGVPAGDDRFGPERTPAWVDFPAGIYGVPDLESRGLKVGIDAHGPPFDPDAGDRVADEASLATARAWLRRRMPALADAPVVETRVCQYENTATGDFLIDRHPEVENVWIAGGGSGHGFKHAPAVGEQVAALVSGHVLETDPRFAMAGQGVEPRRRVF